MQFFRHFNFCCFDKPTCLLILQVMSDEEYEEWLKEHFRAESDIDHREELLLESALRLENNLSLLGESENNVFY